MLSPRLIEQQMNDSASLPLLVHEATNCKDMFLRFFNEPVKSENFNELKRISLERLLILANHVEVLRSLVEKREMTNE
jgi:hypothetical protein